MDRLTRAWTLTQAAWKVLDDNRGLIALPALSAVAAITFAALWFSPFLLLPDLSSIGASAWLWAAIGAVGVASIAVTFEAAVIVAANDRMDGHPTSPWSGLRAACGQAPSIIGWALMVTAVNVVAGLLKNRTVLGSILGRGVELTWNVIAFLGLPALVIEATGPIDAAQRSTRLIRSTWGEQLSTHIGLGILGIVATAPMIAVTVLLTTTGTALSGAVTIVLLATATVVTISASMVLATLNGVVRVALYRWATNRPVPGVLLDADLTTVLR